MTETTATVTCFPFTQYEHGSAGEPMECQVKIGENNEILVKGTGVMKGYYKQPEETAKVFTEDGWLRTGDAGYISETARQVASVGHSGAPPPSAGARLSAPPKAARKRSAPYVNKKTAPHQQIGRAHV